MCRTNSPGKCISVYITHFDYLSNVYAVGIPTHITLYFPSLTTLYTARTYIYGMYTEMGSVILWFWSIIIPISKMSGMSDWLTGWVAHFFDLFLFLNVLCICIQNSFYFTSTRQTLLSYLCNMSISIPGKILARRLHSN